MGQSILESYSRVLESLAFNIIARIDDVVYADDMVKKSVGLPPTPPSSNRPLNQIKRPNGHHNVHLTTTPCSTPYISPNTSPALSPHQILSSSRDHIEGYAVVRGPNLNQVLPDWSNGKLDTTFKKDHELVKLPSEDVKVWSYAGNLESSNALHSPPGRD